MYVSCSRGSGWLLTADGVSGKKAGDGQATTSPITLCCTPDPLDPGGESGARDSGFFGGAEMNWHEYYWLKDQRVRLLIPPNRKRVGWPLALLTSTGKAVRQTANCLIELPNGQRQVRPFRGLRVGD